jgi:hypothetical protein
LRGNSSAPKGRHSKPALNEAHAARANAQTVHDANLAALVRGRDRLLSLEIAINELREIERCAIQRHAEQMEGQTRGGFCGAATPLVMTEEHTTARVTAERTHAAATQMVSSLEAAELTSRQSLADTEAAVKEAAREAARTSVRADFEELQRLNAQRHELREKLLGACFADPGALGDREWRAVDRPGDHSAQEMSVGLPLVGDSVYSDQAYGGDPRPARARIDQAERRYRDRLVEMERGEFTAAERAA